MVIIDPIKKKKKTLIGGYLLAPFDALAIFGDSLSVQSK